MNPLTIEQYDAGSKKGWQAVRHQNSPKGHHRQKPVGENLRVIGDLM